MSAEFASFIAERGFTPPERIEPGRWCPFSTNEKRTDTAGRAKLFPDGEGGIVYDWRTGESWTWQARRHKDFSESERRAWLERIERGRKEAETVRENERKQTAERARAIWEKAEPAPDGHPYLVAKGVKSHGLRLYRGPLAANGMHCDGSLVVPARTSAGELASLQFISPSGEKRYLSGAKYPAAYYGIGKPEGVLLIAEGYATAASLRQATGHAVAVAFDAGNLEAVAQALRAKLPDTKLILCADNDIHDDGKPNTGLDAARKAAQAVGALVAVPELEGRKADFNDLAKGKGNGAVKAAIDTAAAPTASASAQEGRDFSMIGNTALQFDAMRRGNGASEPEVSSVDTWPKPLGEEAFHGLAGEIVKAIEPQTEADPAAILLQILVSFGALAGRGPHVRVEGDQHHPNLFGLVVGNTSKARKGTSWGRNREIFSHVDPVNTGVPEVFWPKVIEGLSSGEGLKWAVRDEITKKESNGSTSEVDPGVRDKRILVVESEFAQVLRQCARAGNTLSSTIRCAWDTGKLQSLTKNDPIVATGAHICIIGHITSDELRAELTQTDSANGFANRFLFMCAKRSKALPFGGEPLSRELLSQFATRLAKAANTSRLRFDGLQMTPAAKVIWEATYQQLSEGQPGLFGAVTARAEAQCLRLALVYALLDEAPHIDKQHIMAALAVWSRAEESARHIFGHSLGDAMADEIDRELRRHPEGVSRTDISKLFNRHQSAERIGVALDLLKRKGRAVYEIQQTSGAPKEIWRCAK